MKLAVYMTGAQKPIIVSDESETDIDNLTNQIETIFKSNTIFKLQTDNDCLIGRPSDIQAILITKEKGSGNASRNNNQ